MQLKDAQLFRQQAFVNGQWLDADNGQTIKVTNPATGEVIGTVPKMGAAETRRAIEAADKALPAWRALTAKERSNKLRRWFELMIENQDDLARLMTTEQGKPLAEAKGEIAYAASFIEWFAEEAKRVYGDTIPGHQPDKRLIVIKQPIGVTAAITPWNFPAAMITRKAGPALAAGCTMVLKPASQTPYSALALAELATRAGIPAGVFSVVTGSAGDIGTELTGNSIVRKLSFTGSTRIGQLLLAQCAATVKRTSMELGGNAPFIVFDDADLDLAIAGVLQSKFRNAGQTCVCANRILVQGHQQGQVLLVLQHERMPALQQYRPLGSRALAPGWPGRFRRGDGAGGFRGLQSGDLGEGFAGGRIVHGEGSAVVGGYPVAVDIGGFFEQAGIPQIEVQRHDGAPSGRSGSESREPWRPPMPNCPARNGAGTRLPRPGRSFCGDQRPNG